LRQIDRCPLARAVRGRARFPYTSSRSRFVSAISALRKCNRSLHFAGLRSSRRRPARPARELDRARIVGPAEGSAGHSQAANLAIYEIDAGADCWIGQ
jgi:hypothetical protein